MTAKIISHTQFRIKRYHRIVDKFCDMYIKEGEKPASKWLYSQKLLEQDHSLLKSMIEETFKRKGYVIKYNNKD